MVARGGFALQAVGPGRYLLRFGALDVVNAATGRAFVLDLNGAEPTRQGAARLSPAERALEELARQRRQGAVLRPMDVP